MHEIQKNEWEIDALRRVMGLKPITYKKTQCRRITYEKEGPYRCVHTFDAQYIGGIQVNHYCERCAYQMGRMIEG